jgi:hypothetical protein
MRRALNKETRNKTQIQFYRTMAIPALAYSSVTWTLTKKWNSRNDTSYKCGVLLIKGSN